MSAQLEFLFDYASPYAYLAARLLPRRLPGVSIRYRPIYLRGLETFSQGIPFSPNKLRYLGQDLLRCAEAEGLPLVIPSEFPINGLQAVRGALVALEQDGFAAYHEAMFRAAWVDDRPVSHAEVVAEIAAQAGLDRQRFAEALARPDLKERLKSDTRAAEERGVFGVPTFLVGDELYWGHDRMDFVVRAVARAGAVSTDVSTRR
jgi:2-hydroxychromene-2-carboxylate isomerase